MCVQAVEQSNTHERFVRIRRSNEKSETSYTLNRRKCQTVSNVLGGIKLEWHVDIRGHRRIDERKWHLLDSGRSRHIPHERTEASLQEGARGPVPPQITFGPLTAPSFCSHNAHIHVDL